MRWETPQIEPIKMDAEINAYQDDFTPRDEEFDAD